jgi:transcription antitermination factor NusG
MMEDRAWYIAELAPGATAVMSQRVPWAGEKVQWSRPPEKYETVVEYALRDAGFTPYLPRMRKEIVHHRTHKIIVRAFPLFTGYLFIGAPASKPRFHDMRATKGVRGLLGLDGRYVALDDAKVGAFRQAEDDLVFDDTREARIRRKQEGRTKAETARMRFPTGSKASITEGPFAGFAGMVESVHGKGLVSLMVEIFSGLRRIEVPVDALQPAA